MSSLTHTCPRFDENVPRITKPDNAKARDAELMSGDKNYADWFNMFVKRQDLPVGWRARLRRKFIGLSQRYFKSD